IQEGRSLFCGDYELFRLVWLVNSFFSFAQIYHFYFNYATIFRKKSSARLKIQTGGACNASVTGRG
ncbi:hypothetical protein, partial [Alistipes putredinis]|uniref:hypothetical protein n=1 Tax=Alistipes putredinis TaxID=28117 RepID=UPI003FD6F96D